MLLRPPKRRPYFFSSGCRAAFCAPNPTIRSLIRRNHSAPSGPTYDVAGQHTPGLPHLDGMPLGNGVLKLTVILGRIAQ